MESENLDIGLQEVGAKTVKRSEKHRCQTILLSKAKFAQKQTFYLAAILQTLFCAAILYPLLVKVFKSETTSFHFFPPRIPKI